MSTSLENSIPILAADGCLAESPYSIESPATRLALSPPGEKSEQATSGEQHAAGLGDGTAEDDVALTSIGVSVWVSSRRSNDEVIDSVAVDVPCATYRITHLNRRMGYAIESQSRSYR